MPMAVSNLMMINPPSLAIAVVVVVAVVAAVAAFVSVELAFPGVDDL